MVKITKIFFYDTKPYDQHSFETANKKYNFDIQYFNGHLNYNSAGLSQGFNVVCPFVNDTIDKKTISILKNCGVELIALRSAGYNNVDLKAAYRNIHVVRVPSYSPYAVAEHAMALILSLNRKTHRAYYRTRDGNFSINGLLGFDLHEKTIGIIGTGKIGECLIDIALGFGMKVIAYDRYLDEKHAKERGFKYVTLEELYNESDVISLHCPLSKETYHLINEDSIKKMKKGVIIINTSRGKIIETESLIKGLKDKQIGAAGLDVYEEESQYFFEDFSSEMISDDMLARLLTFPNVLVTSHQGFFTQEALTNIANTTLQNIKDYFEGKFLENEICYRCGIDASECMKEQKKRCF
ncbi:MAG: hydroxyacid dehydrogenase [Omnitrophica WOR_2 bacterium GWF2_38_59]|nr:MAG: hydroxyacid dehydrogenase [Omnitrophica WOR_2 bacterium GWF2_38_59]OGX54324.1 MAG: hydroxyacid dehydrogenase [Omnitrophica WOR_2 bacterium RIFOXYA12_FULL_38_10]OGX59752.1 MAG: hydroxyacid dehydrogenase [Omnitrophica WOR_2 bacterium RIFOXYC2_FULL_38_12]HBG61596.1 hydroxyacid dehydrogenase [Candidatus Omnitrophota bacterium]